MKICLSSSPVERLPNMPDSLVVLITQDAIPAIVVEVTSLAEATAALDAYAADAATRFPKPLQAYMLPVRGGKSIRGFKQLTWKKYANL